MADFDPDAYLSGGATAQVDFDPDAYLGTDKEFNPDAYLGTAPSAQPVGTRSAPWLTVLSWASIIEMPWSASGTTRLAPVMLRLAPT